MNKMKKIALLLLAVLAFVSLAVFPNGMNTATVEAAIKMNINRSSATLRVGDSVTLKVSGTKSTVKWSSGKTTIATVSSKGVVTAVKNGKSTITATVAEKKFQCIVTVEPYPYDPMLDYSYYEPYKDAKYQKMITKALNTLTSDADVDEATSTGVMLLNRYNFYLKEINNNNAYIGWTNNRCSGVYDYYAFYSMMKQGVINKIVKNAQNGKDAFDGFTGFFERPYYSDYDGSLDSYLIYLPKDYDASKKYPMVVLLHGGGGNYYNDSGTTEDDAFMKKCEEKDVILVCPNGRHKLPKINALYQNEGMEDVLQVMEDVEGYYSVDKSRVYLTGLSMGGFGTWYIGSQHPELFAAIAPLSSYLSDAVITENLVDLPVFAIHGDLDTTCPIEAARSMVQTLKDMGGDATFLELKGYGHTIQLKVFEEMDLLDWFLKYHK